MSWKEEAARLADESGLSWRKIAKRLGKPKSTVSDFLRARKSIDIDGPNILFIDIETSLIQCYVWDIWKQNVRTDAIIKDWYMLCYSAQWGVDGGITNDNLANHTGSMDLSEGEAGLIAGLWTLLDQADVVVAYNGKKFDKKKINAKFLEYGHSEPSPYQVVDPYLVVRNNFDLTSNKMDYVAKLLEQGGKTKTDFSLWLACMQGDRFALAIMQEYCDNDVTELVGVYLKVRGWDKYHPNVALFYNDDERRCNTCGSVDVAPIAAKAHTQVSSFSSYRCNDCGSVMRDRKSTVAKEKRSSLYMNVR